MFFTNNCVWDEFGSTHNNHQTTFRQWRACCLPLQHELLNNQATHYTFDQHAYSRVSCASQCFRGAAGFHTINWATRVIKIIKEENLQLQASKKMTAPEILLYTIPMGTQQSGGVGFLRSHCWWPFGWMVFFIMGMCVETKNINWRKQLDRVK